MVSVCVCRVTDVCGRLLTLGEAQKSHEAMAQCNHSLSKEQLPRCIHNLKNTCWIYNNHDFFFITLLLFWQILVSPNPLKAYSRVLINFWSGRPGFQNRRLGNWVLVSPSSISWKSRRLNTQSSQFFSQLPAINENPVASIRLWSMLIT